MNQVKNARINAGLSQVELAARAGTTQAQISRIESGKSRPSIGTLEAIAKALGCTLTILLEEKMDTCEECAGEGVIHYTEGYRQYGWGYGDCEEIERVRECDECDGTGKKPEEEEETQ